MPALSLKDLLRGLQDAVRSAREMTETQHLRLFDRYFEADEDGVSVRARAVNVSIPSVSIPSEDPTRGALHTIRVPIISLVPINALKIDTLAVEFEARITGADGEERDDGSGLPRKGHADIKLSLGGPGFFRRSTPVKVSVSFKEADPPEGIDRINGKVIKDLY